MTILHNLLNSDLPLSTAKVAASNNNRRLRLLNDEQAVAIDGDDMIGQVCLIELNGKSFESLVVAVQGDQVELEDGRRINKRAVHGRIGLILVPDSENPMDNEENDADSIHIPELPELVDHYGNHCPHCQSPIQLEEFKNVWFFECSGGHFGDAFDFIGFVLFNEEYASVPGQAQFLDAIYDEILTREHALVKA